MRIVNLLKNESNWLPMTNLANVRSAFATGNSSNVCQPIVRNRMGAHRSTNNSITFIIISWSQKRLFAQVGGWEHKRTRTEAKGPREESVWLCDVCRYFSRKQREKKRIIAAWHPLVFER